MHRTRHTAGQRMLDATGNLTAVQALLGHASISTIAARTPTGTCSSWKRRASRPSPPMTTRNDPFANHSPRLTAKSLQWRFHGGGGNRTREIFPPPFANLSNNS
jgi:hypothetical protein